MGLWDRDPFYLVLLGVRKNWDVPLLIHISLTRIGEKFKRGNWLEGIARKKGRRISLKLRIA